MDSRKIGALGEVAAVRFLRAKGYDIVTGNFQTRLGEIDIIAQNKHYLCFVEVKTRGEGMLYTPREAVGYTKRQKIIATAKQYLMLYPTKKQPRFDVVEVYTKNGTVDKIKLIPNAFDAEGR